MAFLGQILEQAWERLLALLRIEAPNRPRIFAVLVVMILGFVGGRILAELVRNLLKMTSLDEFAVRSDVQPLLRKLGYRGSVSDLVADLVKWTIYLLALLSVLYVFGFTFAADYSATIIDWSSRLLLVAAIMMLGAVISDRLEEFTVRLFRVSRITGLVDDSGAEIPVYVIAGRAVKYLGLLVTFLVALGVAGIDILILNVLIGMVALGVIAAAVIGSRDLVRNITISIYFQLSRVFGSEDVVRIGDYEGEIAGIRPLYTKLDSGDRTFYVPNWKLVTEVIELEEG